jgi:hypothetical protein
MDTTISAIERSIKRALSAAEIDAIERVRIHLPADRRQTKRLLRQARERARKAELASMKQAGKIREPGDDELHLSLNALSIWQSPAQFDRRVRELGQRVPTEKLWGNRYKQLREAMTLAGFCQHRRVKEVRMGEDPPDAWLRFEDNEDEEVEITEVLEPGRRRMDEYRRGRAAAATFVPHSQLLARAQLIASQLEKAINAKAGKYPFNPHLLIYLSFPYGRAGPQVQTEITDLRTKYAGHFREIHVVTDTKLL